jgi:hypothetical protein
MSHSAAIAPFLMSATLPFTFFPENKATQFAQK